MADYFKKQIWLLLPVVSHTEGPVYPGILCMRPCWLEIAASGQGHKHSLSKPQHFDMMYYFLSLCGYLISLGPFNLWSEVLHSVVKASVTAQLWLHRGKIRTPLGLINTMLVLLHPSQQVLDVAQGHIIHLRAHLHGGLLDVLRHGSLGGGPGSLQAQVVIAAQVNQTLVESINPIQTTVMFIPDVSAVSIFKLLLSLQ